MNEPVSLQLEPVNRRRAHEEVVHQIRREILAGRLKVGDRLPGERQLSETLGVSRASVREAMRVLEGMSIIRARTGTGPASGSVVVAEVGEVFTDALLMNTVLEKVALAEVIDVRAALEAYACRQAAQVAEPAHLDRMRAVVEEMEAGELERRLFLEQDTLFHLAIAESCGNSLVAHLMGSMREVILHTLGRVFTDAPESAEMRQVVTAEHRDIFEAIDNGDGERAATLVHAHIMKSYDRMRLAGDQSG